MTRKVLFVLSLAMLSAQAHAQLVLNEANAVSADQFVDGTDSSKPYEGYDYGIIPHSGNPGNPWPADVDGSGAVKTSLPNGWDLNTNPSGWARIMGNGGDWIELVVTTDHLDMRGYTFYWENDETDTNGNIVFLPNGDPGDGQVGTHAEERGFVQFSNHSIFSDLRAGTIITLSEDQFVAEGTGYFYDLSTDTSFNPNAGDWHMHFHVDESVTQDQGLDTDYFKGGSDLKVDNDRWRAALFDSSNTALPGQVENASLARTSLDLLTGLIGGFVGESATGHGDNTGGGGVGNDEVLGLITTPTNGDLDLGDSRSAADYEDLDFSTFGTENMFNILFETELDGVQDFSALRAWFVPQLVGDLNGDGFVGQDDLNIILGNWGQNVTIGDWLSGDPSGDGFVGQDDLNDVLAGWGQGTPPSNGLVPEPTTAVLLTIGVTAMLRRRRADHTPR